MDSKQIEQIVGDSIFRILSIELKPGGQYLDLYEEMCAHQTKHLANKTGEVSDVLTTSHRNLLAVLWLHKISPELPGLVCQSGLVDGLQLSDSVVEIGEEIESLLESIQQLETARSGNMAADRLPCENCGFLNQDQHPPASTEENGNVIKLEDEKENKTTLDNLQNKDKHEDWGTGTDIIIKNEFPGDLGEEGQDVGEEEEEELEGRRSRRKCAGRSKTGAFACTRCECHYDTPNAVRRHKTRVHEVTEYDCFTCGLVFPSISILNSHKRSGHKTDNNMYGCDKCDFACSRRERFKDHMFREHKVGTAYQCTSCKFVTCRKYRLTSHVKQVHQNDRRHVCTECGLAYAHASDLRSHVRVKHEGFRHLCDQCDFRSTRTDILTRHIRQIHGEKTFMCDKCGFKASRQLHLRNHKITVHENVKFFPCDQCDYNARRPALLKEHKLTKHQGIKFSCDQCPHQTMRRWHLKRHKLLIHKVDMDSL